MNGSDESIEMATLKTGIDGRVINGYKRNMGGFGLDLFGSG
jgi:hypothetical protein